MRPQDFEHVLAAAAEATGQNEFVVIGSQAILGTYDDPPASLLVSLEADAKAPEGWQSRLVRREIPARVASKRTPVAWCLEIHDLVLSKCVAGRERDWEYAREVLKARLVEPGLLLARIPDLPVQDELRRHIKEMLQVILAQTV